jgi:tRNA nucleotidyltransferase (CCA-adding enzyme)
MKRTLRPAVFCVIYKMENEVPIYLLLKRKLHWKGWEFPKGKIEKGETKEETARREAHEEGGFKVFNLKKYKVSGSYRYEKMLEDRPQYYGQSYTLFSGEVKPANKKAKLDPKEHCGYMWAKFDQAIKKLTWNDQKKCLRIVNKELIK